LPITPGTRLGPYEIVSPIGAGGMGEVWKARDTRLDRSVAIKVLPQDLAANAQFKLRFEREAKAISQLNHPNICTLHDVGEDHGVSYLVMELLDGESLAERLARGPLALADVLRYGIQIAEGLDRAHRAGIVHRDLKPGNIMITSAGAKLLDFGLAKASGAYAAAAPASNDGETEMRGTGTARAPLTAEGTIIGTFQYMAPEQLEGLPADARTDIFALGAVLYEMATGRRAFEGKTRTSLIAAIVSSQPPAITNVQPLAPSSLDHVITQCLAKEPDERWQSARDVAQELRWVQSSASPTPAASRASSRLWMAIAALGLIAAGTLAALYVRERARPREPVSFSIIAPRGYWFRVPVLSPDGGTVVFLAGEQGGDASIWIRRLGSVEATKLFESPGLYPTNLFWSPDSRWIGYVDHGAIMKVALQGGTPEKVCSECVSYGEGAAWSRSGTILFSPKFAEGLFRVPAGGGTPVRVTSLDAKRREYLHGWPVFVDDEDDFVYVDRTLPNQTNELYAGSLDGKRKTFLMKADALVGLWKSNLIFVRDGAMYGQRFDAATMKLSGDPKKIVDDVLYDEENARSVASVSENGALLYLPASNVQSKVEVGWYDRNGRFVEKLFDDVGVSELSLSPDDTKIGVTRMDPKKGANDVYVYDIARGVRTKLTSGLANHHGGLWTPDGSRVLYDADGDGMYDIYSQPDDGATPPQVIWKGGDDKTSHTISPDGKTLLASVFSSKTKDDLWTVPLTGDPSARPAPFIVTDGTDVSARFSPDGKWLLYVSSQSARVEVYVRAYPAGRSVQVSVDGGNNPSWSSDGSEIYFYTRDSMVVAAPFHANGTTPQPGKPEVLFHIPRAMTWWAPSHKPGRFLGMIETAPQEINVANYVTGWAAKLE
jgi:Tol biopolymer transport system component